MISASAKKIFFTAILLYFPALVGSSKSFPIGVGFSFGNYSFDEQESIPKSVWRRTIQHFGAEYLSLHFSKFHLPHGDFIRVRVGDNIAQTIQSNHVNNTTRTMFFTKRVRSEMVTVELFSVGQERSGPSCSCEDLSDAATCFGFEIDSYRHRASLVDDSTSNPVEDKFVIHEGQHHEGSCGLDDSQESRCFANKNTIEEYRSSYAVARLLIHRKDVDVPCTGWLVGSEGHLITNKHCIRNEEDALNTEVEFLAEGRRCDDDCTRFGECDGEHESVSTTLIASSEELDYTLVKLDTKKDLASIYGYLRLRTSRPSKDEPIYIVHHPSGWGKRVSTLEESGKQATVKDVGVTTNCHNSSVIYEADTQPGSSGAPVLSMDDHTVVALHNCGGLDCRNGGIPSHFIATSLIQKFHPNELPSNMLSTQPGPEPFKVDLSEREVIDKVKAHKIELYGRIRRDKDGLAIDHIEIQLNGEDAEFDFDVLSVKLSDQGEFLDVLEDCSSSYIDSAMYLFEVGRRSVLNFNDDNTESGRDDGSVSFRDPFMTQVLKKNKKYRLAIGSVPFTRDEAYEGVAQSSMDANIFNCYDFGDAGSYKLTIKSTHPIDIVKQPRSYSSKIVGNESSSCKSIDICSYTRRRLEKEQRFS